MSNILGNNKFTIQLYSKLQFLGNIIGYVIFSITIIYIVIFLILGYNMLRMVIFVQIEIYKMHVHWCKILLALKFF
jgi:hypothetical protein